MTLNIFLSRIFKFSSIIIKFGSFNKYKKVYSSDHPPLFKPLLFWIVIFSLNNKTFVQQQLELLEQQQSFLIVSLLGFQRLEK